MQHAVLIAYLVAAMFSWVPRSEHQGLEPATETEARYRAIAEDVLEASERAPLFAGEGGAERTALLALSVASFESHFAKRIDTCNPGPKESDRDAAGNATAWTLWQMHVEVGRQKKAHLCASRRNAAEAFLAWASESLLRCRHLEQRDRMSFYTDGVCKANWRRSRSRFERALGWEKAHPIPTVPAGGS